MVLCHRLLFLIILMNMIFSIHCDVTNPDIFLRICGTNQSEDLVSFYSNFRNTTRLVYGNMTTIGFGSGVTGGAFSFYSLGQCFNYLSSIDCKLCYSASIAAVTPCQPATDARVYLEGCFFRYSNYKFFDTAVDASDSSQCSNSTTAKLNSTVFRDNVVELMSNLTRGVVKNRGYYRVGSKDASLGVTVYGMAQCWSSLNASDCRECLASGRERIYRCLPASDGKALNTGCIVRYSTLPFYLESIAGSSGLSGRRGLGAVIGAIIGTVVVIGIVALWIRRRATTISKKYSGEDSSEELIRSIAASGLSFRYDDLKAATDNFSETNKIGQGGFGAVYKGVLVDGKVIAVKRLFSNRRQRADEFFKEVNLVNQIQHKNLVKLLGCSVEGPESLVVYEYLCNTSLEKFLYDALKKNELDWGRRFNIIVGTAEGLTYLHSSSEVRIIHRDIKASNILLDERFNPKVADFGLARYFAEDQSHLSTGLAGTLGYMAPEYIVHGQLTEKADVYSYGILVIEIITGRKNQSPITTSSGGYSLMSMVWQHYNSRSLIQMVDDQLQGQCSHDDALKVIHVALLCTQASPILRPHMWKVVEMLNSRFTDLPLPTEPAFTNIMGVGVNSEGSRVSDNQMPISTMYGR